MILLFPFLVMTTLRFARKNLFLQNKMLAPRVLYACLHGAFGSKYASFKFSRNLKYALWSHQNPRGSHPWSYIWTFPLTSTDSNIVDGFQITIEIDKKKCEGFPVHLLNCLNLFTHDNPWICITSLTTRSVGKF